MDFPVKVGNLIYFTSLFDRRLKNKSLTIDCNNRERFTFIEKKGTLTKIYLNGTMQNVTILDQGDIILPSLDQYFNTHKLEPLQTEASVPSILEIINGIYTPLIELNKLHQNGNNLISGIIGGIGY